MTPEQRTILQELIDEVETKYVEFCSPDTPIHQLSHFKSVEEKIFAYVDSLLAPSLFEQVMTASERYVTRFGGALSLEGAMTKMHEEWQEMHDEIAQVTIEEALDVLGAPSRVSSAKLLLAKEAIDLLVTIGGVLAALRTPITMTVDAAHVTLDKLDNRTTDDYAWNGKTVERKDKVQS